MDVPAVDDPRVTVTIPVPIKGRKPLILKLPRFDFIDEATIDAMTAEADALNQDDTLTQRKIRRMSTLVMLKPLVPAKDYAVCEGLPLGQLDAVMLEWSDKSSISLGELLASAPPSTGNTEAPSAMTSTSAAGPAATSDAA